MGGRPGKTFAVLTAERAGHRTKAELELRRQAEKALMTGTRMRESEAVKADAAAHAHFRRVRGLMSAIGHDDAIHEQVINRYCLLLSECERLDQDAARLRAMAEEAGTAEAAAQLYSLALRTDGEVQRKRSMLLAIEKENLMTVSSGIRAVPKTPSKDTGEDPMLQLLESRG